MNSHISNLLAKHATSAICGAAGFASGLTASYIYNRVKKNSVVIVPAEPEASVTVNPTLVPHVNIDGALEALLREEEAIQKANSDNFVPTPPVIGVPMEDQDYWRETSDGETEAEHAEEAEKVPTGYNVFLNPDPDWDYEAELNQRDPELPYVIHVDEFMADELRYKQESVTYYEGDDIMASQADVPIYNWNALMGDLKWGHGSKDRNVVYIRNEKQHKEWEVLLHRGSFEIEVLGLHIEGGELKHSLRKFRDD